MLPSVFSIDVNLSTQVRFPRISSWLLDSNQNRVLASGLCDTVFTLVVAKAPLSNPKQFFDQGNVFTHVRGSVCLSFDRLRCACVASMLRVFVWLGLLAVNRVMFCK